jgi:carboxymethylenebutenolidase
MRGRVEAGDPRVQGLVEELQGQRISRRQFLERGAALLGTLAAANSLLAACTLPGADPTAAPAAAATPTLSAPTAGATPTPGGVQATSEAAATSDVPAGTPDDHIVDYEGPGEGFLALPEGAGPFPAVVVIQEWWGLDVHITDVAGRFASEGFIALAPDLYHGRVATEPGEAQKLAMALEQDVALEEIQNAINYLAARPDVAPARVGVIGFCMGGGLALQLAVRGEKVGVVASFYGAPLTPEQARQVKAPVFGSYGSKDRFAQADLDAMVAAIKEAGFEAEVKMYPAEHAFFNDRRNSYEPASAEDAWQRTLAAFRRYLGRL